MARWKWACGGNKGRKDFFFEKKKQKTFAYFAFAAFGSSCATRGCQTDESSLVLSFKKEHSSYQANGRAAASRWASDPGP
jgi:hypothetical protein